MKNLFLLFSILTIGFANTHAQTQPFKFAHVSDTHIGNETSAEDLRRTIKDINADNEIKFVVITGDITEFGSDDELRTAKAMLDSLNKPWYIVPGNHDMNWSESGGNSFRKIFGSETFAAKQQGYLFIGTNCGPNLRMSPGQIPRENIVWLDSVLKATPVETPVIFVNHYPIDSALNNWYEVIDRLKTRNTQLILCGHGHANAKQNFEGIPGVMGRSNLRAKDSIGGYNIVTIARDSVFYNERTPGVRTKPTWRKLPLTKLDFKTDKKYRRPSLAVNGQFKQVKVAWALQDDSDIGAGPAVDGDRVIINNTQGWVKAYSLKAGSLLWQTRLGGKIYSIPRVEGNYVLVPCSDNYLYCLDRKTGKVRWKTASEKPMVASAVTKGNRVFCGGSDGHFKCYDLATGKVLWDYNQVKGFVVTRPLLYGPNIYFGDWGNHLHALNQQTGKPAWTWTSGAANRMFSPAACEPVATGNRIFIVAPDRFMTCIDATTGSQLWRKKGDDSTRVRESMGLSADSSLVYVKTMNGAVLGVDTKADSMKITWKAKRNIGYDISPSRMEERGGLVFALSNSGVVYAFKREDGTLVWAHKISNALVNPLSFVSDSQLVASTMDGKIVCLRW